MHRVITDPSFDAWLSGFLLANPELTVRDAVNFWLDQDAMQDQWETEQARLDDESIKLKQGETS